MAAGVGQRRDARQASAALGKALACREGTGRRALAGGRAGRRAEVEKGAWRCSPAVDTPILRMPASLGELCPAPETVTDLRGGFLVFLPTPFPKSLRENTCCSLR